MKKASEPAAPQRPTTQEINRRTKRFAHTGTQLAAQMQHDQLVRTLGQTTKAKKPGGAPGRLSR